MARTAELPLGTQEGALSNGFPVLQDEVKSVVMYVAAGANGETGEIPPQARVEVLIETLGAPTLAFMLSRDNPSTQLAGPVTKYYLRRLHNGVSTDGRTAVATAVMLET